MTQPRGSTVTTERARSTDRGAAGPGGQLGLFYRQVVAELRKVIRPTREQLWTYWTAVLVFVVVVIAIVSILDFGIGWLMLKIFS